MNNLWDTLTEGEWLTGASGIWGARHNHRRPVAETQFGSIVSPEEYSLALEAALVEMLKNGITAECRGAGLARFIYAERGVRAVEISGLMPGASLEMFDNGIELSTPDPFETLAGATAEAIAWLTEKG